MKSQIDPLRHFKVFFHLEKAPSPNCFCSKFNDSSEYLKYQSMHKLNHTTRRCLCGGKILYQCKHCKTICERWNYYKYHKKCDVKAPVPKLVIVKERKLHPLACKPKDTSEYFNNPIIICNEPTRELLSQSPTTASQKFEVLMEKLPNQILRSPFEINLTGTLGEDFNNIILNPFLDESNI